MLDKKQIERFSYSSSKWVVKQWRQLATSTHLAQELLTNVQCSCGSRSFAKETRALKTSRAVTAMGSWQWPIERIIEADILTTARKIAKELCWPFYIQHLKQIGKVKRLCKWVPPQLITSQNIVLLKCHLLLFYKTTTNHFSIELWCAMKSGFYTTTGDDQLSDWIEKKLQSTSKAKLAPK